MNRQITARLRLAIGAAGIVVSALLMAAFVGILPDDRLSIAQGRAQLCESIAVYSSAMLAQGETSMMELSLAALARHNPQIRSVGIRRADGHLLSSAGEHLQHWTLTDGQASSSDAIRVPLMSQGATWGTVEVAFSPLNQSGWSAVLRERAVAFPLLAGAATCVMFWFYFGRMLKQLDPNAAVPGRVREALDVLAESLVLIDHKGIIRFANRVFVDLLRVPSNRLVGQSIRTLPWSEPADQDAPDADHAAVPMPWEISQRSGQALVGQMLEITDAHGKQRTLNISCSPVLAAGGMVRGVMVCCDDVTHLEEIKVQLRSARDRADAASAAKSAFVANMSHEIRTPLNAVLGFADVLRRGMASSRDEEVEYLDMIHRSGHHLLELINDILDLSKIEAGRLQVEQIDTSVWQITDDVVSVLSQRAAEKGLALNVEFQSELPEFIQSDPTKLRQIITNLTGNAIKFTERGSVTIAVCMNRGKQPEIEIAVRDTGIGMTPEQQLRIFDAFQQADGSTTRRFGGTGLGLAISRQFAEAMGGSLSVSSEADAGSTFLVKIPTGSLRRTRLVPVAEIKAAIKQRSGEIEVAGSLRLLPKQVLVVDDGEANRRLIELILRRAGAIVTTGGDGRDALKEISRTPFDLVLMDMQMPVLDGYQATTMIRSTGCDVPIIALTGNAMKGDRERCLDVGCNEFLTKPVNVDLLIKTVAAFIGAEQPSNATSATSAEAPVTVEQDLENCVEQMQNTLDRQLRGADGAPRQTRPTHSPRPHRQTAPNRQSAPNHQSAPIRSTLPMDDQEFREIVIDFIPKLKQQFALMQQALSRADYKQLAELAHWMKGSAGTTGFQPLVEPSAELQQTASQNHAEECFRLVELLGELIGWIETPTAVQTAKDRASASSMS